MEKKFNSKIEGLKKQISALQKGVADLKASGIRENILFIAIQKSAGIHHGGNNPIPIGHIKNILEGIENLDSYLFPEEEK